MENREPIKVAIIDDNREMRHVLSQSLNQHDDFTVVAVSSSGNAFLSVLTSMSRNDRPEVIISDIHMPGMSGIEVVSHVKAIHPEIKFIMLSVASDDDLVHKAIQAGASGYLLKSESVAAVKEHVLQLVYDDEIPMSPEITKKVVDILSKVDQSNNQKSQRSLQETYNLTQREEQVLNLLVDGMDYKAIAKQMYISPYTVRKHISNLYGKLHVTSKAQAIKLMLSSPTTIQSSSDVIQKHRIMLVDDHQLVLDSLSMMLSAQPSYQIACTSSDPTTVAEYLSEHQIDLVISDINMPGLNGIDLAKTIKFRFPDVKVLLLTVSDNLQEVQRAFEVGVDGYILKKTGKKELTSAIDSILAGNSHFGAFLPAV